MKGNLNVVAPNYEERWKNLKEMYISNIKEDVNRSYNSNINRGKVHKSATIMFFTAVAFLLITLFTPAIRSWFNDFCDKHTFLCVLCALPFVLSLMIVSSERFPFTKNRKEVESEYKEIVKLIGILDNITLNTEDAFEKLKETWEYAWTEFLSSGTIWSSFSAKMMQPNIAKILLFHNIETHTVVSYSHDNDSIMLDLADESGNVVVGERFSCKIKHNTNINQDSLSMENGDIILTKKYIL